MPDIEKTPKNKNAKRKQTESINKNVSPSKKSKKNSPATPNTKQGKKVQFNKNQTTPKNKKQNIQVKTPKPAKSNEPHVVSKKQEKKFMIVQKNKQFKEEIRKLRSGKLSLNETKSINWTLVENRVKQMQNKIPSSKIGKRKLRLYMRLLKFKETGDLKVFNENIDVPNTGKNTPETVKQTKSKPNKKAQKEENKKKKVDVKMDSDEEESDDDEEQSESANDEEKFESANDSEEDDQNDEDESNDDDDDEQGESDDDDDDDDDEEDENDEEEKPKMKPFKGAKATEQQQDKKKRHSVFVSNVSFEAKEDDIKEHFAKAGDVISVRIPKSNDKPKGFALVDFKSEEAQKKALSLHHSFLNGRRINVQIDNSGKNKGAKDFNKGNQKKNSKFSPMKNKGQFGDDNDNQDEEGEESKMKPCKDTKVIQQKDKKKRYCLFVGNLPYEIKENDIKEHFVKAGNAISVRIPHSNDKPKGFAYVEFNNEEAYKKALSLHHSFLKGRRINVEYTMSGKNKGSKDFKKEIKKKNFKFNAMKKKGQFGGKNKWNSNKTNKQTQK